MGRPWVMQGFFATCVLGMLGHYGFGCSGWDPRRPFERSNADVDRAIQMIEDGEYENAQEVLSDYLGGGQCKNGKIELTDKARKKADGTFDLGLVIFYLAEKYGRRFGEEAVPEGGVDDAELVEKRDLEIKCGLIVAVGIARDPQLPPDLRARAMYLAGNLEFLRGNYKDAIKYYEESLKLVPGIPEDQQGDGIGRDAAWNRATALRRLEKEQEKDGGQQEQEPQPQPQPQDDPQNPQGPEKQDGGGDDKGDAGNDAGDKESPEANDAGPDGGQDGGPEDGGKNGSQSPDAGDDPQDPRDPQNQDPEQADPGGPSGQQGDRVLDQFEQVPTYQQEDAKKRSEGRRRNMEDK